ncbi:hypothetical protein MPSEU_001039000 [Mayamaea pseudoterrestris]|nr:hypothetical protein MPSEU_001039000 [Mayamaea pseudoterrestris]
MKPQQSASPTVQPQHLLQQQQRFYGLLTVALMSFCLLCQSAFRLEQTTRIQREIATTSKTSDTFTNPKINIHVADDRVMSKDKKQKRKTGVERPFSLRNPGSSHSIPSDALSRSTRAVPKDSAAADALAYTRDYEFPPLESLVLPVNATSDKFPRKPTPFASDEHLIIGDVRQMLDFAILGHAKTATSYLAKWFHTHPEMQIWNDEVCDLVELRPADLVRKLHTELPPNAANVTYQRGFKCPGRLSRTSLRYFRDYFSNAKVIVGVRHPVRWFESYYNFRWRHNKAGYGDLPDAASMVGRACSKDMQGVCLEHANFHAHLAMFGKTNLSDPDEQNLVQLPEKYYGMRIIKTPVFLYDMEQLYDKDPANLSLFKADLQAFMGLKTPLPDDSEVAKKTHTVKKKRKMDICEVRYTPLRAELLEIGKRASTWIRKYFLSSPQAFVSNRKHFEAIVKKWEMDPCDDSVRVKAIQ